MEPAADSFAAPSPSAAAGSVYADPAFRYTWPVSFYERIAQNRRNTRTAFAAFVLLDTVSFGLYAVAVTLIAMGIFGYLEGETAGAVRSVGTALGWAFTYAFPFGMVLGALVGLASGAMAFGRSGVQYLSMAGAYAVTDAARDPRLHRLREMAERMAIAAQLPVPQAYVMPSPCLNAFAVGDLQGNGHVVVTSALLESLTEPELEAVVAHEMSHVHNRDSHLMGVVIALAAVPLMLPSVAGRILWSGGEDGGPRWIGGGGGGGRRSNSGGNAGLVLVLLGVAIWVGTWLAAKAASALLSAFVSQEREYLADATAARLCRNPRALAQALYKIENLGTPGLPPRLDRMEALFITSPVDARRKRASSLLSTHPTTEERIRRLMAM